jgi:hypothetical protein
MAAAASQVSATRWLTAGSGCGPRHPGTVLVLLPLCAPVSYMI